MDETLVDVFDAVLINEGFSDLVAQKRVLRPEGATPVQQLGKPVGSAVYAPFSLRQTVEFVVFLPLNLIPLVGVPVFLMMTGYRAGPFHHYRYFKLLHLNKKAKQAMISKMKLQYTWFGTMALLLQLVPALSMLFLLTTAAGSAMWVARLERSRRDVAPTDITSGGAYHDNPVA